MVNNGWGLARGRLLRSVKAMLRVKYMYTRLLRYHYDKCVMRVMSDCHV